MPLRLSHDAYRVGWICPLEVEQIAAMEMLDEEHERLPQSRGDTNVYSLGSINGHNVVIAGFPQVGNRFAATVVTQMRMTFPSLRYSLLVGIGGGVPVETEHGMIRLGHVVVSEPTGVHSGAVQYDHGKARAGQFERKGFLAPPPTALLNAARELAVHRQRVGHDPVWMNAKRIQTDRRALRRFGFPGAAKDYLYQPHYKHRLKGVSCEQCGCDPRERIGRSLEDQHDSFVVIHRGTIASGELVIKDARKRDQLAREHKVLCFEMEAAGALTDFPCMIIRGISDYCDSHKNDIWHGYAAAMAAAYARQLFFHMPLEDARRPGIETELSRLNISPQKSQRIERILHSAQSVTQGKDHQAQTFYVIPSLANRHFTGRQTTLEDFQQKLFSQVDTQRLALYGLGGSGKTQVALQLAHWVKNNISQCSVFWVPALSLESFEQACSQIVKKVGIQRRSDDQSVMELVCYYLSSDSAGRWLFIVDNADDPDLLFSELIQYFPISENGSTLLTTRSREVAVLFAERDIIELQMMSLAEGTAFLTKIVRDDLLCDRETISQLLEELLFLPLAIAQAAFYISRVGIKITRYLEIMHNTEKDRTNLASRDFYDRTRYPGMSNAVATTWFISFNQIKHSDPLAADLLKFLSYIEPKAIPRSMLPVVGSEEDMEFAIGTLCSYALLTPRDNGNTFDMHSLVQLSTRLWAEKTGDTREAIENAIRHMDDCFPSDEYINREIWRAYLPHAIRIVRRGESTNISQRYNLLTKIGHCILADGRRKDAVGFYEEIYIWQKSLTDEEDSDKLSSQHTLATAYSRTGQIEQAVELLEHVVAVQGRTLDEEDPFQLASQHELAIAYVEDGRFTQAAELLEHVVAVRERTLDEHHAYLLGSQHELAIAYQDTGQIKLAMELLEHVVGVRGRILDEEHPELLRSQYELAITYRSDGQIKRAMELLEHVVAIEKRTLDQEHPDRVSSEQALANTKKEIRYIAG